MEKEESKSRSKEGSTQRSRYFGLEQGDGPSKSLSVQVSFSSLSFFTFLLSILTACQNEQRDCQSECTTIVISFPVKPTIC